MIATQAATSMFRTPRSRALAALICAACIAAPTHGQWFTNVTAGPLVNTDNSRGASWADYDNDGDLDLYFTVWDGPNFLLRNDGGDVFTDVTAGSIIAPGYSGRAVWGDIDNDGDLDVYIAQSLGSLLLRNHGGGNFIDITGGSPLNMNGRIGRGAAWADYNGDGFIDLYVTAWGGPDNGNRLMRNMNGSGAFANATVSPLNDGGVGRGVQWCDYDNDGDQDMYFANGAPGGDGVQHWTNKLLRNDNGVFVDVSAGPLSDTGHGRGVAWGDFDNDGDFDLYICNIEVDVPAEPNRLLRNDGGVFVDATPPLLELTEQTRDCAWIDYDNDGDVDLYVTASFAPNRLFRNDGGGVFTDVSIAPINNLGNNNAAAWGDYNRDGRLDVYIVNKFDGNVLLRNDIDNGNHWIELQLVGTVSNRSAIGARVTATAGGVTQIREVNSGSGYLTQHMLDVHFGFGASSVIDLLEIRWPNGAVEQFTDVATDRVIVIRELGDRADINADGSVDGADLAELLGAWGTSDPAADVNLDGTVDGADLAFLLGAWS